MSERKTEPWQETEIERLKRIVGTQSVMLHDLKEKIQSMVRNASNAPGDRLELWEVIAMLLEWANECDRLTEEEVRKLGIQKLKKGAPIHD